MPPKRRGAAAASAAAAGGVATPQRTLKGFVGISKSAASVGTPAASAKKNALLATTTTTTTTPSKLPVPSEPKTTRTLGKPKKLVVVVEEEEKVEKEEGKEEKRETPVEDVAAPEPEEPTTRPIVKPTPTPKKSKKASPTKKKTPARSAKGAKKVDTTPSVKDWIVKTPAVAAVTATPQSTVGSPPKANLGKKRKAATTSPTDTVDHPDIAAAADADIPAKRTRKQASPDRTFVLNGGEVDKVILSPTEGASFAAAEALSHIAVAESVDEDVSADDAQVHDLDLLIIFHRSLLTVLMLHKAQNPSGVSPSYATIKPHIEALSRRRFSLQHLRQIVFLSHYPYHVHHNPTTYVPVSGLKLIDYGAGKLCIDVLPAPGRPVHAIDAHRAAFQVSCDKFSAAVAASVGSMAVTVPMATVHPYKHKATIQHVLHSKTKGLLTDLKSAAASKMTKPGALSGLKSIVVKPGSAASRGQSLLERIRAKQAAATKPPTKDELLRHAAQGRIPEVLDVLKALRAGGKSLGLGEVVESVRGSSRSPMSAAEAELAVRMVADREGWCDVRAMNGVSAVVFWKDKEVGKEFV